MGTQRKKAARPLARHPYKHVVWAKANSLNHWKLFCCVSFSNAQVPFHVLTHIDASEEAHARLARCFPLSGLTPSTF